MPQKKEYRNAIRSRNMIRAAFQELLREKPIEKITATDVINRSGLNRSTFYAHYPDVKGIVDELTGEIVSMFRSMLAEMDFSQFMNDPAPTVISIVRFLEQNQELYRLLGRSNSALVYQEQLKATLIRQVLDTPNLPVESISDVCVQIRIRMLMSSMIDVYRTWLAGEIDCSLEEMSAEVTKFISAKIQ